ncbi:MAG: hypothetical protein FJ335_12855 [Sphingomonadales bacterium]|nr:hypothetical protein [Sphingomonadales bacterium]
MIARGLAATATIATTTVAAIAQDKGAIVTMQPTVWHVLGYGFQAGPMIAALVACFAVRFYSIQKDYPTYRWSLDVPISALALMFSAGAVIRVQPDPILALVWGTGFGVLGAGIIALAKKYVDRALAAMGLSDVKD